MEKEEPDTISDAGLESEEYLVIHIGDSFTTKQVSDDQIRTKDSELWFFQVSDTSELLYRPYKLRDDSGNLVGSIDPDTGVSYQRLWDESGDDILRIEDFNWRVYHYSLGVQQDNVRVYPRIPDNQNGGAFDWLSGSEPRPQDGDPYGYIPSTRTDFEDPSISLEAVSWETASRTPIQYGFYNEGNSAVDPVISVRGFGYELRPVEQQQEKLRILADMSRPEGRRQFAIKSVDYSGNSLRSFSFDPPSAWKDASNNLNVSRVNTPGSIDDALEKIKDKRDEIGDGGDSNGVLQ